MAGDDDEEIRVLSHREAVRKRAALYVGNVTDGTGLHAMALQPLDDIVAGHKARITTEVRVTITDGWIVIEDDGPTLAGRRDVAEFFTAWSVINPLSAHLEGEVVRNGIRYAMTFERGVLVGEPRALGPATHVTNVQRFRPDPEIFGSVVIDLARIEARLREIAWLNPLLRVFFQEQRLLARGGVAGWVSELSSSTVVFSSHVITEELAIDLAMAWRTDSAPMIHGFVNGHPCAHGTHIEGMWLGVAEFARLVKARVKANTDVRRVMSPGLVAVVHVSGFSPRLSGEHDEVLATPWVKQRVANAVRIALHQRARYSGNSELLRERLGFAPNQAPGLA